jgi:hypothetical protein
VPNGPAVQPLFTYISAGEAGRRLRCGASVETHVNAMFTKLGLSSEALSHRRVTAVLTFPRDAGLRG